MSFAVWVICWIILLCLVFNLWYVWKYYNPPFNRLTTSGAWRILALPPLVLFMVIMGIWG